jgi:hypothetical protein
MKWRSRSDKPDDSSLIIELTHPSGPVVFDDPEVRSRNEGVQFRAMVDADTWRRIREHDIFGASSRTRQQGPLPNDQPLRITVFTEQALPDNPRLMPAEQFVILDAMHPVDLTDSGLEGEVWEGVAFSEPKPWTLAITQLADEGFLPYNGLPSATTVRRSDDDVSIEFRHHEAAKVIHAQAIVALPMGDDVNPAAFQVVNGINAAMPFSVTMIDAGDLIVREIVPDETGDNAPELIAARVAELVGIITSIRETVITVAQGNMTATDALAAIFS